jgi:site-specific DNA-methyltransferase (adenine-specific)
MGIRNHQYSSISIEKLAAGAIGSIDEMLAVVALEIARLTMRWALVFSDAESIHLWRDSLEGEGMRYVRTGAWFKPDPMPQFSGDRPSVGFEPCTIMHAKGPMRWNGGGSAATWTYGTVKKDRPDHPCPKPLGLMRELVSLFTNPEELILDPFAGSGTTLIAAKSLGREAIGIEIDEKFCEVAAKRLDDQDRQGSIDFKATQETMVFA